MEHQVIYPVCKMDVCDINSEENEMKEDVFSDFDRLSVKLENAFKNLGLTRFSSSVAKQYLIGKLNEGQHEKFARVTGYIVDLLNNKKLSTKTVIVDGEINTTQSGCPNVISGLTARPFWDTSNFPWIQALEDSYPDIKREFIALREQQQPDNCESEQAPSHFQHYRSPKSSTDISSTDSFTDGRQTSDHLGAIATSKGDWNVCYLHLHGVDFARNLEACPVTSEAIRSIPRHYHHAMFSALAPDTHVKAHFGPTNKKLRCHLPLHIPRNTINATNSPDTVDTIAANRSAATLTVAGQTVSLQEGRAVLFDDSFLHEAANSSVSEPRVVLIVDVWHPDLSDEEVKFLEFINNAQVKAAQRLSKLQQEQEGGEESDTTSSVAEDFFGVIQRGRREGVREEDRGAIWAERL